MCSDISVSYWSNITPSSTYVFNSKNVTLSVICKKKLFNWKSSKFLNFLGNLLLMRCITK